MTTRTGYPGTTTAGDVLHSADITKLPGGWLGYVEKTTTQSGISTVTDISGLSVTVTVGTSRTIRVTGHFGGFEVSATSYVKGSIWEGSTELGLFVNVNVLIAQRECGEGSVFLQPTAGSHTYKLRAEVSTGTVDIVSTAGGDPGQSFILVEDIGPV